jgi:hypothetical protein
MLAGEACGQVVQRRREMEWAKRFRGDGVIPVILLIFAGGYAWLTMRLPARNIAGTVGVSLVPLLLAGLLALLALLLLAQGLRRGASPAAGEVPGWVQAGSVVGMMAVYIVALTKVGFPLATPPYLAITMWQCGARRPWYILGMAVAITTAVWIVFWSLFGVPLPRGPLF